MTTSQQAHADYYSHRVKKGSHGIEMDVLGGAALKPSEAIQLNLLVKGFRPEACLEVGTGLGASAVAISSALRDSGSGRLWTLDPFQDACGEIGVTEIKRLGMSDYVEFCPVLAENFLQRALADHQGFDLFFQDGAHSVGPKMTHTFLGAQALRPGGLFVFHDAFKPCTAACVSFLVKELGYGILPLPAESRTKRLLRSLKYGTKYGAWYGREIVPMTHLNLVALTKPR